MPNVWDRLTEDEGPRPSRASLEAKFEGKLSELVEWANSTFKSPDGLYVKATVSMVPFPVEAPKPKVVTKVDLDPTSPGYAARLALMNMGAFTPEQVETVLTRAAELCRTSKIEAIKYMREMTRWDLKTAKDYVEGPLARAT